MSSYFDKMGACLRDPNAVAELVHDQYHAYLMWLNEEAATPEDNDKIIKILNEFHHIDRRYAEKRDPERFVSDLHSLAHEVGRAGINLKDGCMAGDNPRLVY